MGEQHPERRLGMDVTSVRREHRSRPLRRNDLAEDPLQQFQLWFSQARDSSLLEPNAMSLATVDDDGRPALRTVLLKYFDDRGFVFFTNLGSNKAAQIAANPHVALLFYWSPFDHQVVVRGRADRLPTPEVLRYFLTRPRGSQIGAWVSDQSRAISSRSLLAAKFDEMKRKFAEGEVPLPDFWGGFRVTPVEVEFWQGQPNRLHDRFLYRRQGDASWAIERLQP